MHTEFLWRNLKEIEHLEVLGVNGRLILKIDLKAIGCDGVDWIYLAKEKAMWLDLVIALIKFWVS
jgi:hypothetical protein